MTKFDSIINEDAGRGTGIQAFKGLSDVIKNLKQTVSVDAFNKAPANATDFNLMNYYSLDVRHKTSEIIQKVQTQEKLYVPVFEQAMISVGLTEEENRNRFIAFLRGVGKGEDIKFESLDKFDVIYNQILTENPLLPKAKVPTTATSGALPKDAEKHVADMVASKKLARTQTLEYISPKGVPSTVIIDALPNQSYETASGSVEKLGTLQVAIKKSEDSPSTAVNIFNDDGSIAFPSLETEKASIWKDEWDTLTVAQLLQVPELKEATADLSFIIGMKDTTKSTACILRPEMFVNTVIRSLVSAFRGQVKQGVTLEEILTGKFTQKVINPEKGAFINKVKDPTSRQPLDFRAWNDEDLQMFHNIIKYTFIDSPPKPLEELVVYLTEEDFDRFIKGGEGLSKLAGNVAKAMGSNVDILNI